MDRAWQRTDHGSDNIADSVVEHRSQRIVDCSDGRDIAKQAACPLCENDSIGQRTLKEC